MDLLSTSLHQVIKPSLDDIQQALNKATVCVLEVSRGVAQWGQKRYYVMQSPVSSHFQPSHIDVCKGKVTTSGRVPHNAWKIMEALPENSAILCKLVSQV